MNDAEREILLLESKINSKKKEWMNPQNKAKRERIDQEIVDLESQLIPSKRVCGRRNLRGCGRSVAETQQTKMLHLLVPQEQKIFWSHWKRSQGNWKSR